MPLTEWYLKIAAFMLHEFHLSLKNLRKVTFCSKLSYRSVRTFAPTKSILTFVSCNFAVDSSLLLVHLAKCAFLSGTIYIQGCGHRIFSEEWGMLWPLSERAPYRDRDAGDLQEPGLLGDDNPRQKLVTSSMAFEFSLLSLKLGILACLLKVSNPCS